MNKSACTYWQMLAKCYFKLKAATETNVDFTDAELDLHHTLYTGNLKSFMSHSDNEYTVNAFVHAYTFNLHPQKISMHSGTRSIQINQVSLILVCWGPVKSQYTLH